MNKKSALRLLAVLLAVSLLPVFSAQALADDAFFCRKCGKAIPADSNFCPYCGEAVIVLPTPTAETEPKEDKSVTDAIIAELIASIRTAASENSRPASAAAAAAPAAEPETTEPGPFQTVRTGNSLVYNDQPSSSHGRITTQASPGTVSNHPNFGKKSHRIFGVRSKERDRC